MTCRALAVMVVILTFSAGARAVIIYTNDGKAHNVIVLRESEGGYSVLLLDGTRKYYRKDDITRIDRSNKFAETYFAIAGSLDLEEKGGSGYFWLAYWSEKNNKEGARFLYTVGLQEDETSPFAAYQLSLIDTDQQELIGHLRLATAGCPWVTNLDVKRLTVAENLSYEAMQSIDKRTVVIFYNIVKQISHNIARKATTLWGDFYTGSSKTPTITFLEGLCKAHTGYDFKTLDQEMLYLAGSADKTLWMCATCKGAGKVKCSKCKGAGYFMCDRCKGTALIQKRVSGPSGTYIKRVKCDKCRGTGYAICPVCRRYTQFQHTMRISVGRSIRTIKVSGFKTCPTCKGSGRKAGAPDIKGRVSFIALKGEQARTAFKNLEIQVWRLLSTEDSWASTPLRIAEPSDFIHDMRSIPYRFYNGRWITSSAIDELIATRKYTPPSPDAALLEQYYTQLAAMAIPKISKGAVPLSGDDSHRDALANLADYYEFISTTGGRSSYEFRKVYRITFKKGQAGRDNINAFLPGETHELLLRKEKSKLLVNEYYVEVVENVAGKVSQLLDKALEVTIYARITRVSRMVSHSEDSLVISHEIEISPLAATIKRSDGKTYEWVKTETSQRPTGLIIGN